MPTHCGDLTLSSLIEKLNERFGTDFTLADQLFFEQIEEIAKTNEQLQEAAMANSLNNFERVFNKMLEGLFIERMEGNEDIFRRLMEDGHFRTMAASHLAEKVYHGIRENVV
jgi:type I restriction enzyme R subunit